MAGLTFLVSVNHLSSCIAVIQMWYWGESVSYLVKPTLGMFLLRVIYSRSAKGANGNISCDTIHIALFRTAEQNIIGNWDHNIDCATQEDRLTHVATDRVQV